MFEFTFNGIYGSKLNIVYLNTILQALTNYTIYYLNDLIS